MTYRLAENSVAPPSTHTGSVNTHGSSRGYCREARPASLCTCASLKVGVLPSLPLAAGRLTPSTRLAATALRFAQLVKQRGQGKSLRRDDLTATLRATETP